jgi:hypothetical protein
VKKIAKLSQEVPDRSAFKAGLTGSKKKPDHNLYPGTAQQ